MHGSESFVSFIDNDPTHTLIFHNCTLFLPVDDTDEVEVAFSTSAGTCTAAHFLPRANVRNSPPPLA